MKCFYCNQSVDKEHAGDSLRTQLERSGKVRDVLVGQIKEKDTTIYELNCRVAQLKEEITRLRGMRQCGALATPVEQEEVVSSAVCVLIDGHDGVFHEDAHGMQFVSSGEKAGLR